MVAVSCWPTLPGWLRCPTHTLPHTLIPTVGHCNTLLVVAVGCSPHTLHLRLHSPLRLPRLRLRLRWQTGYYVITDVTVGFLLIYVTDSRVVTLRTYSRLRLIWLVAVVAVDLLPPFYTVGWVDPVARRPTVDTGRSPGYPPLTPVTTPVPHLVVARSQHAAGFGSDLITGSPLPAVAGSAYPAPVQPVEHTHLLRLCCTCRLCQPPPRICPFLLRLPRTRTFT